jgi:non-specific serine/threonine protein kinase/serine/threonine-protein kinase
MANDWKVVKAKFAEALEMGPDRRTAFLDQICADQPELRAEIESLLAAHEKATEFLSHPISLLLAGEPACASVGPGDRLGVYTIVQKIDEGGMAAVYQGVRDDAEFRKLVAIKILKAGMDTQFILDRFYKEKQILAHLDHPNIAKLLDGGTTPDGRPYFVLEFIAGLPIDVYCKERHLSIDDRLRLIQKVSGAVEYAHQNLIVHRDLKPRNILVMDDGTPKLLDFGIAKILSDERELTMTGVRLMTPEYASPEQIRGESISTMTDVYCLGVILYELLTGGRPFRATTAPELASLIVGTEPKRPSTAVRSAEHGAPLPCDSAHVRRWADRLRGDLDKIVLKAMHADPQRRYRSIGDFSTDIDRYFARQPVQAVGDDLSYRARKFVARHRTGVFATLAVVLSLLAGLIVVQREAMIARKQHAMSEQRAREIRRLANSLIFDLHDAIQSLPGATPIRATLMDRAANALDSLSSSAPNDAAIQRELAGAYQRLAEVQGAPLQPNLGNTSAALASYRKAQASLDRLHAASPSDLDLTRSLATVCWEMGMIFSRQGDRRNRDEFGRRALELREIAARARPETLESKRDLAMAYYMRGHMAVEAGNLEAARHARRQSYELWESVLTANPDDARAPYEVALAAKNLAAVEQRFQDLPAATQLLERARELDQRRATASPQDAGAQLDLSFDLSELAELSIRTGDLRGAAERYRQARTIREELLGRDPGNQRLKDRTSYILSREGRVQQRLHRFPEAGRAFQRALILRRELAADQTNVHAQFSVAESEGDWGSWQCSAGDAKRGRSELTRALAAIAELDRRKLLTVEDQESAAELRSLLEDCRSSNR